MTDADTLKQAKAALTQVRHESRIVAQRYEAELNAEVERRVDQTAMDALRNGMSRSAIARALGESRVTVNLRLHRASGESPKVARVKAITVEAKSDREWPYRIEGNNLVVEYETYGPEDITGSGTLEIIKDEDADYWFLQVEGQPISEAVAEELDTMFSGWYYEDALEYVKTHINEGEE